MASVRKVKWAGPDGRQKEAWGVDYTDAAGKRRRKTPDSGLKRDAEKLRTQIENELARREHVPASTSLTMENLSKEYMRSLEGRCRENRGVGTGYVDDACGAMKVLLPGIEKKKVSDLSFGDVELIAKKLADRGNMPKTIRNRLDHLARMIDFAVKRRIVHGNVAREVIKDRRGGAVQPVRTFTRAEVLKVLSALQVKRPISKQKSWDRMRIFVHVAAFHGLRFGEITALTVGAVDLQHSVLKVRKSMTRKRLIKGPKTRAGVRDVALAPHVAVLIRDWIEAHRLTDNEAFLFATKDAMFHNSNFSAEWGRLLEYADIETKGPGGRPHFHALRHFAASLMIENGYPVTEVASILGHRSFDVTLQVYAHALAGGSRRADMAERMAASLLPAPILELAAAK